MWRKREAHTFSLFPSSTASFFFMRYFHWSTEREPLRRTTCISSLSRLQYVQYVLLWLLWDESDNSVGCVCAGGGGGSIHPNIRILEVSIQQTKKPVHISSKGQLIMKFKPLERKPIQKKLKSTFSIILLAHLLRYWVVWYALLLILFFGLQDTKETVIWNVGEISDT